MKKIYAFFVAIIWRLGEYFSRLHYGEDSREEDFLKGVMRRGGKRFY